MINIRNVIREIVQIWEKYRIPSRSERNAIAKLKKLYQNVIALNKNTTNKKGFQEKQENEFEQTLENLFEIAHHNAMEMMPSEDDKQFLELQRQNNIPGSAYAKRRRVSTARSQLLDNESSGSSFVLSQPSRL